MSGSAPGKAAAAAATTGGSAGSSTLPCCNPCADTKAVDAVVQKYKDMIAKARKDGYNVAADNLEHWLKGSGTSTNPSASWLRGFSDVTDAERVNQGRFEQSLLNEAYKLNDGQTTTFRDYWDRQLTGGLATELFYASGTSTITSSGSFTLSRTGDTVTITGSVYHRWHDPYDWHDGLGAYIPGFGVISDSDALLVEQCRGAKPFRMGSDWKQTVNGKLTIKNWWPDSSEFNWKGP
jgi:hypothetical protein